MYRPNRLVGKSVLLLTHRFPHQIFRVDCKDKATRTVEDVGRGGAKQGVVECAEGQKAHAISTLNKVIAMRPTLDRT